MVIKQIVNEVFKSNTYVLSNDKCNWVWLIDIGNIKGVLDFLSPMKVVKGVFITHAHFDHIYGLNELIKSFPDCIIFTSEYGKKGLFSDKMNLSYYHKVPLNFMGSNVQVLHENDRVKLFENCFLETIETPGHNWGCLTYKIRNYLFTGDSFIPNFKVVTKLKGGDRVASKKSLQKIMSNISKNTIICPGHGKMTQIKK